MSSLLSSANPHSLSSHKSPSFSSTTPHSSSPSCSSCDTRSVSSWKAASSSLLPQAPQPSPSTLQLSQPLLPIGTALNSYSQAFAFWASKDFRWTLPYQKWVFSDRIFFIHTLSVCPFGRIPTRFGFAWWSSSSDGFRCVSKRFEKDSSALFKLCYLVDEYHLVDGFILTFPFDCWFWDLFIQSIDVQTEDWKKFHGMADLCWTWHRGKIDGWERQDECDRWVTTADSWCYFAVQTELWTFFLHLLIFSIRFLIKSISYSNIEIFNMYLEHKIFN